MSMRIAAILLAAGNSRRFGAANKLLTQIGGQPLIRRVAKEIALSADVQVVVVTGYEEAIAVFHDTAVFSSCNSVTGPFPGFPVPLVGDDVSALIDATAASCR